MSSRRLAWIAWATVCVVWGTTYSAIRIALDTVPPFLMGALRYLPAGCILGGLLALNGRRLPPPSAWGRLAALGFFMLLIGNGGVVWAEQYVPSGLTSVLTATTPFWMVGIDAALRDGKQLFWRQWAGLVVGFSGITLLVWPDIMAGGASGRGFAIGVISLQLACCGWAIGSAYTRRHVMPSDILGAAAIQMVCGGLWMLAAGTLTGEWSHVAFTTRTVLALGYLSIMGSVVGFAAFSYALKHLDVAVVSLYTYVNPVIALAIGTLALGEPFRLRMLVAAGIVLTGVLIVSPPIRRR